MTVGMTSRSSVQEFKLVPRTLPRNPYKTYGTDRTYMIAPLTYKSHESYRSHPGSRTWPLFINPSLWPLRPCCEIFCSPPLEGSVSIHYFSGWNAAPDLVGGHGFRDYRSNPDDGAVTDLDASKDHRIASNQHIFSNFDWGGLYLLIPHSFRTQSIAVIVVRENNIRSDTAIVADLDPALDIEFHVSSNEDAIADHDVGSRVPETIKFEVDVRFQFTSTANLQLMRPRDFTSRNASTGADFGAQ
jgi:hypothetical protein